MTYLRRRECGDRVEQGLDMRNVVRNWSVSPNKARALLIIAVLYLAGRAIPTAGADLPSFAKPKQVLWLDQVGRH